MPGSQKLIVHDEARELLRMVVPIADGIRFGDLANQMQRSAISVISNIAEGKGSGTDKNYAKFIRIARASVNELEAQLEIAADLGNNSAAAILLANRIGRRLTALLRYLTPD